MFYCFSIGYKNAKSGKMSKKPLDLNVRLCSNRKYRKCLYINGEVKMKIINQSGRSMVEMLGVLAIVGVLSVGAIAGYSKAMMKHKINKTLDEISNIVANVRTVFNGKYEGLDSRTNPDTLKGLNIIPENMWQETEIVNSFGGNIILSGTDGYFSLQYTGLSSDVCTNLAIQSWSSDGGFLTIGACNSISCDNASIADTYISNSSNWSDMGWAPQEGEVYIPYWEGPMSLTNANLAGVVCTTTSEFSISQ